MKELFIVIVILLSPFVVSSQDKDSAIIADIYNEALLSGFSMNTLQYLCTEIGPRMTGTEQADKAVEYTYEVMQKLNVDSVYKQEVKVPNWNIYKRASATLYQDGKEQNLNVDAVGGSVGTSGKELKAQVVEIRSRKEIKRLGRENLEGKIVFLNQKMDATLLNPFQAYGEAAWQRVHGASEAAEYGAVAVLIRSLSLTADDYPHTGIMRYKEGVEKIPSLALSTNDANLLSRILRACPDCEIGLSLDAKWEEDTISYNVVGEIRGSKYPEEIITVGGHLDSWFNDPGAHDDGAGCVQSIEVLRIFKKLGIQPKRTIRVVMFMDEEIWQTGGKEYAKQAKESNKKYIAAIESDAGGTTPVGFSCTDSVAVVYMQKWNEIFSKYGIRYIRKGWGGVDIGPLREHGVPLIGLNVDPHRYFEYHHCTNDTFDKVHQRELQLGAAAMTALVYLIDQYGMQASQ